MGHVFDVDLLVDAAVRLGDELSRAFHEVLLGCVQKEVVAEDVLALLELLLGAVKVETDKESLDELRDGVLVFVGLLLDDLDELLHLALSALGSDDGNRKVAQDPGARGLDRVDVLRGKEHVDDRVTATRVVEDDVQRPVDQPGALLQLLQSRHILVIDRLPQLLHLLQSAVPVTRQNLGRELAPQCREAALLVCRQDAEMVQHVGRTTVVAAVEFELAKLVEDVDVLFGELQ